MLGNAGGGMAAGEVEECDERKSGDTRRGKEVGECGFRAFLASAFFGFSCGYREHGDNLCDAREDTGYSLASHDGLGICPHSKTGYIGEDTVLAEPSCETGQEDHEHEEGEVRVR